MRPTLTRSLALALGTALAVLAAAPAQAQVSPGNGKPLPAAARQAPPFQALTGDSSSSGSSGPAVRIVTGTVTDAGSYGGGYSVIVIPAGSGGTSLTGTVSLFTGSTSILGNGTRFRSELVRNQYIMVPDSSSPAGFDFYRVSHVGSDTLLTLARAYTGSNLSGATAVKNMTLFNAWRIVFDQPFQNPPALTATARGQEPATGDLPHVNVMQIKQAAPDSVEVFQYQAPFEPYLPGANVPFDFVAVGQ